jgi:predicted HTH domain antitoxin
MTITLPDNPALTEMGEAEIRIDLACGAYAAGHLSRQLAAEVAGVSRYDFDQALYIRRIPSFTEEMLAQDLESQQRTGTDRILLA